MMMVNETILTKPEQMEKGNLNTDFRNELFEAYYDPDITPLTKEEWREILEKYDDAFCGNERNNINVGKFKEPPPCNPREELFTDEDWADILERTERISDEDIKDVDTEQIMREIEAKYGDNDTGIDDENYIMKRKNRPRKRLPRRGGRSRRRPRNVADITILHSNCDGYISKKESLEDIVKKREADILLLNETALKGKRKVKIKDYFSFVKNREKIKGGVATVVSNYLKPNTIKVTEGKEEDEYIITRFDHVVPALNLVTIYGQQESKTSNEDITASWQRLQKDLEDIEDRGEALLLLGDLNRAIGSDQFGITGNNDKVSHGGSSSET